MKHDIFQLRKEGMFNKLTLRHNNSKFQNIFRIAIEQFDFMIDLIKEDVFKKL